MLFVRMYLYVGYLCAREHVCMLFVRALGPIELCIWYLFYDQYIYLYFKYILANMHVVIKVSRKEEDV